MSVIVKGMEMPNIPAFREKDNKVAFPAAVVLEKGKAPRLVVNYKIGYVDTNLKAYELVEVPTPHGRLIDCERATFPTAFRYNTNDYAKGWNACIKAVQTAPTVIEAEGKE